MDIDPASVQHATHLVQSNALEAQVKLAHQGREDSPLQAASSRWAGIPSLSGGQVTAGAVPPLEYSGGGKLQPGGATASGTAQQQEQPVPLCSVDPKNIGFMREAAWDFVICNPPFFSDGGGSHGPSAAFGGTSGEMATAGGEVSFMKSMIRDSAQHASDVVWFTCMLGKKSSMMELQGWLQDTHGVTQFETTAFFQGHTTRWGVAWTFTASVWESRCFNTVGRNVATADGGTSIPVFADSSPDPGSEVLNAAECQFEVSNAGEGHEIWGRIAAATGLRDGPAAALQQFAGDVAEAPFVADAHSHWLEYNAECALLRVATEQEWALSSSVGQSGAKRARSDSPGNEKQLPPSAQALLLMCTVTKKDSCFTVRLVKVVSNSQSSISFSQCAVSFKQNVQRSNRFWRRRAKLGSGGGTLAKQSKVE